MPRELYAERRLLHANDAHAGGDRSSIARRSLWGAPRTHGELLKLGFEVAQSSVAKYMVKRCGLPSPAWEAPARAAGAL